MGLALVSPSFRDFMWEWVPADPDHLSRSISTGTEVDLVMWGPTDVPVYNFSLPTEDIKDKMCDITTGKNAKTRGGFGRRRSHGYSVTHE